MIFEIATDVQDLFRRARRAPLLAAAERDRGPSLDRPVVERLLPHRDPFLLVDRITAIDRNRETIVARSDLGRATAVFAGHFPTRPVYPGVLQVEAVGQAGLCLLRLRDGLEGAGPSFALTQVLAAEFVRPVHPGGELEIVTRLVHDDIFIILVGQCLQQEAVCSVAAVRGMAREERG